MTGGSECASINIGKENCMSIKHALIIPDPHFPFVKRSAYELMLQVAQDLPRLDEIIILGDFLDFYGVSSWAKDPAIGTKLLDEIEIGNQELDRLDKLFPEVNKVFLEGNHCNRLKRFINSKAPELFGTVEVSELLKLEERGYKFIPFGPTQLHKVLDSKLYARHAPIGGATHAAHNSVVKAGCSLIMGDGHRIQESQVVTINGEVHRGIMTGWLGDETHPVFSYVKGHHQWCHGFSIVTVLENGDFFNQTVPIINDKCQYGGYVYYG